MLVVVEQRELHCPADRPLMGWRIFRVRSSASGLVLAAPLTHDRGFEQFPTGTIEARCYERPEHDAPAPGCQCGLYAAIEGTLDSLAGYLKDSAHGSDPPIYAEVACTGRVFVDARGVRAQRIEVVRLAMAPSARPHPAVDERATAQLGARYGVEVNGVGTVPAWVLANDLPQGAPPDGGAIDLDALVAGIGFEPL